MSTKRKTTREREREKERERERERESVEHNMIFCFDVLGRQSGKTTKIRNKYAKEA